MGNTFHLQSFADENGYPNTVFISDSDGDIAKHRNPLKIPILDLERFYDMLTPFMELYRKYMEQYNAHMGEEGPKPTIKVNFSKFQ